MGWGAQVQHDGLLMHSASFGPILGPITTLTSLANFKARSLPTPRANAEAEPAACSNEVPAEPDSTAGPEESPTGEAPVSRAANNRMAASKHAEEAAAAQLEASVLQQSGSAHEESGSARSRGLSRSSLPNCDASGAGDAAPLAAASAQRAFGATAAGSEEQPDGGSKPASGSVQATASQVPQVGSGTGEASAQLRFVREASCAGGSASARGLAALLNGLPTTAGPPLSTSTHNSRDASPSVPARRGVSADARSQGDQPLQNHQQAVHRDGRKAHAQDKPSGVEAVRFENGGLSEETLGHRSRVHRKCNGFDAQSPSDVTTKSAQLVSPTSHISHNVSTECCCNENYHPGLTKLTLMLWFWAGVGGPCRCGGRVCQHSGIPGAMWPLAAPAAGARTPRRAHSPGAGSGKGRSCREHCAAKSVANVALIETLFEAARLSAGAGNNQKSVHPSHLLDT